MKHENNLAVHRKTWGITQGEVGALVGMTAHSIGNYELGDRTPGLETAIALSLLFGHPIPKLFPEHVRAVAERVSHAAAEWSIQVEAMAEEAVTKRLDLLRVLSDRLSNALLEL